MAFAIRPLQSDDLPALSRFLTGGFGTAPDAEFAAADVLHWKYLEPIMGDDAPRSFIACARDQIIGHVGICRTAWIGPNLPNEGISTLHMIDWLGSRTERAVGTSLMRHAHREAETQYVLIANDRARHVTTRAGYTPAAKVMLFQKVLRAGYRWKIAKQTSAGRVLRVVKDTAQKIFQRERSPRIGVALSEVDAFGPEIAPILDQMRRRFTLTDRSPQRLNYLLRYPRPGLSGWRVEAEGRVRGFAVLNLLHHEGVQTGKLVECILDEAGAGLEHAAISALSQKLAEQGADVIVSFASTPAMTAALLESGFALASQRELTLRDRAQKLPQGALFHISPFEADCAHQV